MMASNFLFLLLDIHVHVVRLFLTTTDQLFYQFVLTRSALHNLTEVSLIHCDRFHRLFTVIEGLNAYLSLSLIIFRFFFTRTELRNVAS